MASEPADTPASTFPDATELEGAIAQTEIEANRTVGDAAAALATDADRFARYADIEDLALSIEKSEEARELADAMLPIRNAIADELWRRELFVAVEIIDHLLFEALTASDGKSVLQSVVERLRDARVDEAGLLIFGVHSLGLILDDFSALLAARGLEIIDADWGIAITAQTNSIDATMDFLERVGAAFGIRGRLRRESIRHWRRAPQTRWLESNPLLAVRVAEAAGTYYGNERLLLTRLQAATVLVSMLSALQPASGDSGRATLSTYVFNNQQTLDIEHYLVLSPGRAPGEELGGDCVPIHRSRAELVAMSELRLDLNTAYWTTNKQEADRVATAVSAIYRAYLGAGFDRTTDGVDAGRNRRWFEALVYFQRSFSGQKWHDTITLATAFELLLYNPAKGETSRLVRKAIKKLTGGQGDVYADAFGRVYRARNEIIHAGTQTTDFDLEEARRAFVAAFLGHVAEEGLV
jgi:hypothetical protein